MELLRNKIDFLTLKRSLTCFTCNVQKLHKLFVKLQARPKEKLSENHILAIDIPITFTQIGLELHDNLDHLCIVNKFLSGMQLFHF